MIQNKFGLFDSGPWCEVGLNSHASAMNFLYFPATCQ